jgi:hypothetical protein
MWRWLCALLSLFASASTALHSSVQPPLARSDGRVCGIALSMALRIARTTSWTYASSAVLFAGLRGGGKACLSALWYVPSSNRLQSRFGGFSSYCTLMFITVLMGRWSESWPRSRSTWLLITRSTRPTVTRHRSIVVREVLSSYVMDPGGRVLFRLKSPMIANRSADSESVCLTFAPPHMGWCRLKSPSRICSLA